MTQDNNIILITTSIVIAAGPQQQSLDMMTILFRTLSPVTHDSSRATLTLIDSGK